jgi:propionate CoA-transferase
MKNKLFMTADEAVSMIQDNDCVVTGGFVSSCCPEALTTALENRFLMEGAPRDLMLVFAAGQGKRNGKGNDHFAHEGMVRKVIGGHWDRGPSLGKMALDNKIQAYNLPQGVISHLFRDIAAGKIGTLTHVGLNTFVDPRVDGAKLNNTTDEDIVHLVDIHGHERLFYKSFPIDVCLLRGTYADEHGNVTLEKEIGPLDTTAMAQAAKNSGGKVFVQVEKVVSAGSLDPKLVKLPKIFVDAIVLGDEETSMQCLDCEYDPSLTGELRVPLQKKAASPLNAKKVIARRAAMELCENAVVNLGVGVPEMISSVAAEEGVGNSMTLTVEAGAIGGMPKPGAQFGAASNPDSILDQNVIFDFYDGGGLDVAFLGMAQTDEGGNINVSKFNGRLAGCGGFINITQNAKKVCFCGTFTAGGLQTVIQDGKLHILQEGRNQKFIDTVEQITFSGEYAQNTKQPVLYITERAVFELRADGLYLIEVAPGIDIEKDVVAHMGFTPKMADEVKIMDACLFEEGTMNLKKHLKNK